jgi:RNA polymerase-binding transcription factor DksA
MMDQKHSQMTPEKTQHFYNRLKDRSVELHELIDSFEKAAHERSIEGRGELSKYRLHPADEGSEEDLRDLDLRLRERSIRELREVENAIAKFDKGIYGICERTGRDINIARLEALPETRFELARQEEVELEDSAHQRYEEPFRRQTGISKQAIDSGDHENTGNWISRD